MSTTVTNVSWTGLLADNGIKADLNTLTANSTLSYSAALQLLTDVGSDGLVTPVEFGDLQTVAAHLNAGLGTTSYVASIFDQLVLGSPANASWNGGTSIVTALGNLHAGSSSAQLNQLIGKWFLGTDMPDPTLFQGSDGSTQQPIYRTYAAPLYGPSGAAEAADIAQGAAGDCVLCSGLIQMTENHADLLRSMIVDNGNNSYGVRFYVNGNESWVTVNNEFPGISFRDTTYAKLGQDDAPAMWVALVEKAYAQLSSTGMIGHAATNSYDNIWADSAANVLPNLANTGGVTYYMSDSDGWNTGKAAIIAAIANHQDVSVETAKNSTTQYDADGKETLIVNHSHAVVGYDEATGNFIVRNPWGQETGQHWATEFEVSMDTIAAQHGDIAVATPLKATIDAGKGSHYVGGGASVGVAPLFSVYNPAGLPVSKYLLQLSGNGSLQLNSAHNLATPAQAALGQLVVSAAELSNIFYTAPGDLSGNADLSVSALLGTAWSQPGNIVLKYYHSGSTAVAADAVVVPGSHNLVAAGGSTSLAQLFTLGGSGAHASYYTVQLQADSGSLDFHGAKNYSSTSEQADGYYHFAAADLAQISFSFAPGASSATLAVTAYNGSGWTSFQDVAIDTGASVAAAMQASANGQWALASHVLDSAANVFDNLDWIQGALNNDAMKALVLTDTTPSRLSLTGAQLRADRGALELIDGPYTLAVSGVSAADAASLSGKLLGHLATASVSDQAAAVAAQLDTLRALAATGHLGSIHLSDSGTPHLTLSADQLAANGAVLQALDGPYNLTVSGSAAVIAAGVSKLPAAKQIDFAVSDSAANVVAQLDALQLLADAGKLSSIALTGSGTAALLLTPQQLNDDATALSKLVGTYHLGSTTPVDVDTALHFTAGAVNTVMVADSAEHVAAQLDALQALHASGKLSALTLTDSELPTITLSAAQLVADAALLHAISGAHTFNAAGISNGVAQFLVDQNAAGHHMTTGIKPAAGSNAVTGFQAASFAGGYNAVVLDEARSHYAVQVDHSGKLLLKDIAVEDAGYGQSVAVSGASYVVFGGAVADDKGNYPSMYFIANSQNAAVAELYMAAFGRQPDLAGLEYWQDLSGKGVTLQSIAASFAESNEFKARFSAAATPSDHGGASDRAFVTAVYDNVLHRAPDTAGLDYWVSGLAHGGTRADILVSFAVSAEDVANTNAITGHDGGWLIDTGKGYADSNAIQLVGVAGPG